MIETRNINKYFNKNKSNEIHVINNTSLKFPEKGLTTLIGSSGSGKTTLLNVISGLDSAKGEIIFDNISIPRYKSSTWDKIRANDIGFVFQNYYLLENKSVYENIKLTLNMIGIVDEEEVEYRIHYVLDAVGMFRFRNRRASDLSGGQKQRVAIARAIAKNPKVVIADEPTGNLDTKNSNEVMKIIKKISEERLVILVTHEKDLANRYSDYIVSLVDGKVVNKEENFGSSSQAKDFDDKNIYLGNLNKHSVDEKLEIYSNSLENDINIRIIKINNNYYIESKDQNAKFNIVTPKSGIKVFNQTKEEVEELGTFETSFSLDELEKVKTKRVKKRTLSFKDAFIEAIKKITNLGRKSKIQVFALIMLGIMFSIAVHTLFSSLYIDDSKIFTDKNIYYTNSLNAYENIKDNDEVIVYAKPRLMGYFFGIDTEGAYYNYHITFKDQIPVDVLNDNDLILGRMPENAYEVVVDVNLLSNENTDNYEFVRAGIIRPNHLIGEKLKIGIYQLDNEVFKIVGLVDTNTHAIYLDNNLINSVASDYMFEVFGDSDKSVYFPIVTNNSYNLVEGRDPETLLDDSTIEVLVNINYKDELLLNNGENINFILRNMNYDVKEINIVGYFESNNDYLELIVNDDVYKSLEKDIVESFDYYLYDTGRNNLNNEDLYTNLWESKLEDLKNAQTAGLSTSITQIVISIAISGLIFYFLVRSSITGRVKEISILRSLGVHKIEVVGSYSLEYAVLTAVTSLIGVLIGAVITNSISRSFLGGFFTIRVTPLSFVVTIVGIFITNVLIALIPLMLLLRKTPAQMLTNYDI